MDVAGTPVEFRLIGVVGTGTMGSGIAQLAATAGHDVVLFDNHTGAAETTAHEIGERLRHASERGKIARDDAAAITRRLSVAPSLAGLADCDLVIEAVSEDLTTKQSLLAHLEEIVGSDAILATNTSSLSIDDLARPLAQKERLVGMHFFNPAPVMALVEIVSGEHTSPGVAERCYRLVEAWGKQPVHCGSTPGFIGNYVNRPFYLEALRLREEGVADERTIDQLMRAAGGFRMGPFELMDLVGVDVNLAVSETVWQALGHDPRFEPSGIQRTMVKVGKLGRKTGRGFYPYDVKGAGRRHRTVPPGRQPYSVRVGPTAGGLDELVERARRAGVRVERGAELDGIEVGDVRLLLTDGFTAMEHTLGSAIPAVIVDWSHDLATTGSLGIASGVSGALPVAAGFLDRAGIESVLLADRPGLVVGRITCAIINLAAEAATDQVATADDIDTAMLAGFSYPEGPISWGRRLGASTVTGMLEQLGRHLDPRRYYPTAGLETALTTPT